MNPLIFFLTFFTGFGNPSPDPVGARAIIETKDNTPIILITKENVYNGFDTKKTIVDLPPGKHQVVIIGKVKKQNGKHVKEMLFQGQIELAKGLETHLQLHGKRMKILSIKPLASQPEVVTRHSFHPVPVDIDENYVPGNSTVNDTRFSEFLTDLATYRHDLNKRKRALELIEENFISTAQAIELVRILDQEHSRLMVAKYAFGSVVDPENYGDMLCEFTEKKSENTLMEYMIEFY